MERDPKGRFAPSSEFLRWFKEQFSGVEFPLVRDAALKGWCARDAEIARLRAEVERLNKQVDHWQAMGRQARARVAELETALQRKRKID